MAKASEADLRMAMDLCAAIDNLIGWSPCVPEAVERLAGGAEAEPFDRDSPEQCVRVLGHLLDLAATGSLMRVVWGCAVMLDARNKCVDPALDVIDLHPDARLGFSARSARPRHEWRDDDGAVLWWRFPLTEPPWCGRPIDQGWTGQYTHWTPLLMPCLPEETGDLDGHQAPRTHT